MELVYSETETAYRDAVRDFETTARRADGDARMLTIPDGTTQVHKLVIGRELTGISAFA